jgi:cation transport regulator ChaB
MMKLIKDAIVSMRSIIYFDALNSMIDQYIKDNKKDVITYGSKTKMKYNKWKK